MEPIRHRPQDITPGRPAPARPVVPTGQRAVFSDFTTRPRPIATPMRPATPAPNPAAPLAATQPSPAVAQPRPATQPVQPIQPRPAAPQAPTTPAQFTPPAQPFASIPQQPVRPIQAAPIAPALSAPIASQQPLQPQHKSSHAAAPKTHKHRSESGHAGLAGFIAFVLFAGLLLSPLLPGKTLDNFPGSSQSVSSGDQSLACLNALTNVTSALTYDIKLGSPITYKYATTTTQKALCDGKQQTAIGGHSSQFNPLGLLADSALALVASIAIAKVWRRIFGDND